MKKLFALLLALCMVLGLAACGQTAPASPAAEAPAAEAPAAEAPAAEAPAAEAPAAEAPAAEAPAEATKMTIALRGGTYADVIKECLPAFEAENNVSIEVLDLGEDDLHSSIALDAINATGTYDLVMVDGSWMAEFTANGVLANLTELGYELDDDIIPATTAICVVDGQTYLAPYYGNVTVLLYNKALVEAAGFTGSDIANLDDIMTICKAAKDAGQKGFIYRGDSNNNTVVDFLPILLSFGGWVIDEETNAPTVNTPEFKAAMEFYLELVATGEAEKKDDLIASVDTGAAAMGVGWPGWYTPTADTTADYTAITGVAHDGDPAYLANVYGVWTIGVPANSPHPELAVKLISYLMDKDVQLATVPSGGVPCRYSALQNPEVLATYPQYEVVCKALEGGKYRPVLAQWPQMYDILGAELGNILQGVKTVDQGLADAQSRLESEIDW